ncbi:saccharopine dehydrogenase NADP-binding domain-containing protein [Sphingomonas asaccharolytica]|uniref:saccharopine dehydrogenase NADP-binding domain-containing protein n=1 Tax=Sphingomonas asaccharolytica TaxID=40681 RepID=UPI001C3FE932|nr:saccharopine dehydrogenase NADP-binding domain-containing protein [Sphingomonas asaccharolytica]
MAAIKVAVLGASGHTGRFVVDALRQKGAAAIPATRSGRFVALGGGEEACHIIDFSQGESLDRALAGADAVINCAGPFFDTAGPAAEAALRARMPYLDVAAEQRTVLDLFERFDAPARAAGVTILPAMAFYGGLADLLVSALVPGPDRVETIDIAVGLDSWHPTRGTRLTGERNTFKRLIIRDGELVPIPEPAPSGPWTFPAPFGVQPVTCVALSEIILLSRHVDAAAVTSFMNLKPLADLHDARTPPQASDAHGRSAQQFVLDVRLTSDGKEWRAHASGRDIYAVTAPLVVEACIDLVTGAAAPGVRTPGEIFEPRSFLARLAPLIVVDFEDKPSMAKSSDTRPLAVSPS